MNRKYIYSLFLIGFLWSCEKDDEVDLKIPFQKKLVSAIIIGNTDTGFSAFLSYTSPVYGSISSGEPIIAEKANAFITTEGNTYELVYDSIIKRHTQSLRGKSITAGQTFNIKVSDSKETVTGKCTIPGNASIILNLQFDSSLDNTPYYYKARFTYKLTSPEKKYIFLIPKIIFADSSQVEMQEEQFTPLKEVTNNTTMEKQFVVGYTFLLFPVRIECKVCVCDEAFAKYYNTSTTFNLFSVLPIGSPPLTYSNMSNKIGVIAAYNQIGNFKFNIP
jgi:Domain of unknown function (DUF4249)